MFCKGCKYFRDEIAGYCNLYRGPVDATDDACKSRDTNAGGRI